SLLSTATGADDPDPRLAVAASPAQCDHLALVMQTLEPGATMRAASLLGVFVVAKVCVLAGRDVPCSGWAPIAYVWQDLLVEGLFAAVDYLLRRSWAGWMAYASIAIYVAVNVPVARVLSTPLTWPLLRAARGPLWDSIVAYVTWANVM